jgi:hypothetical protein
VAGTPPTAGISGPAAPLGSGANVCLDLSEQEDEQGLRAATCYERSFHLRSYGSSDGKALSPCSIVFGQSQKEDSQKFAKAVFWEVGIAPPYPVCRSVPMIPENVVLPPLRVWTTGADSAHRTGCANPKRLPSLSRNQAPRSPEPLLG